MNKQKQRLKSVADLTSQYGPPDRSTNLSRKRYTSDLPSSSNAPKRQAVSVDNDIILCIPNNHPDNLGKCARIKFENKEEEEEWYEGVITGKLVSTSLQMDRLKRHCLMMRT